MLCQKFVNQKKGSSVSKRSSEQPFNWDEDSTRVLPTADNDSTEISPTRVISWVDTQDDATQVLAPLASEDPTVPLQRQAFSPATEDETVVLPQQSNSAQDDETVVLPQQGRSNREVADDKTVLLPAQTAQQPRVAPYQPAPAAQSTAYPTPRAPERFPQDAAQEPTTNSRGLQTLRPSNIRQTRPTTWAMIQHIMTLVTLCLLLWATVIFFVQTSVGQILDETAFEEFSYQFLGYQEQTMKILDWIPGIAGILAVIGLIFVLVWKHRFVPAIIGVLVALGANGTAQILKNYVITKPYLGIQEAALNSAPSGHTTFAAAAGAALFLASPKKLRPSVALLGALFTIAAGFSTVVNGWHRPADVISAIFLTGAWTVIGLMILRFMRSEELDMSNTRRSGFILIPLSTITCFFMGFCAVALYLVNAYEPFPGATLAAASCAIISAQTFTTSMLVSLLRPQNKQRKVYTKFWTY